MAPEGFPKRAKSLGVYAVRAAEVTRERMSRGVAASAARVVK
jgi:hypothetical protein